MLFGTNDANEVVAGQTVQRVYHTPKAGIPASWSGSTPAGILPVDSIRPYLKDVAGGKLDAKLKAYWSTFPEHSLVTIWHEGNDPNHNLNAADLKAAHAHCAKLVSMAGLSVHYGAIFGTYPIWQKDQSLSDWLPDLGPGTWVGADCYLNPWKDKETPQLLFGGFTSQTSKCSPKSGKIITETNVNIKLADQQRSWYDKCINFAISHGYIGFMPWGNPSNPQNVSQLGADLLVHIASRCTTSALA